MTDHESSLSALVESMIAPVLEAGAAIEAIRDRGYDVDTKSDGSVVTEADIKAEAILKAAIEELDKDAVVVGEESYQQDSRNRPATSFWLLDPLDGTREFVNGGEEYTVNAALVQDGNPILGLVMQPPTGKLWAGSSLGRLAFAQNRAGVRTPLYVKPQENKPPVVLTSRRSRDPLTKEWIKRLGKHDRQSFSSSLKICMIAEGLAQVYPRVGQTSEWDTAAGHAVLLAAGGLVCDGQGQVLHYGKPDHLNGPFVAAASKTWVDRLGSKPDVASSGKRD